MVMPNPPQRNKAKDIDLLPFSSNDYRRGTAPFAKITRSPSGLKTKSRNFLMEGLGSPVTTKRKSRVRK
jgi:hypothetical protein